MAIETKGNVLYNDLTILSLRNGRAGRGFCRGLF